VKPPVRPPRTRLVHNEQTKLLSTYVNSIAVALFAAGVLAPLLSVAGGTPGAGRLQLAAAMIGCMIASGGLHFLARRLLQGLDE
jgi:hypothetical protein